MDFAAHLASADAAVVGHLGAEVTYTPGVGDAVPVTGIFDAAHEQVDAGQPGVTSSGPAVFLRLSDLPSDPETDTDATVTVDGVLYRPWEPAKDGQGGVLLRLHRAT